MPSARPCAAFEPIPPDFDVKAVVESTPNFEFAARIQADMIDHQGIESFEKLVLMHGVIGGKPLVVEGYERKLDRWTFAQQWLRDNVGSKVENPRDLTKKVTVPMTFSHYLSNMALLTNQWTNKNFKDAGRQRVYLKDIDCPPLWHDKLQAIIPSFLFYLNESTGDLGGFGAVDERDPNGPGLRRGKGIAKAGDLMSCLPKEMRAENMMCYIGHEGTYTPAHREMCASLGQNIMVEASTGAVEDGRLTKPGSSIWFMTESKERAVVSEYWLSRLGHDIEVENHFAQINAWKAAPFKVYVVEQKPGDFILIPPLAPHQVWNRGTRTMKVAWNRTTVETLEMALNEALPRARMVCRDEQYKNKAMIFYALQHYSKLLKQADKMREKQRPSSKPKSAELKVRQLQKDFRRLHGLFARILVSESFLPNQQDKAELVPFEGYITCSYCRCNIFNRFLTCPSCIQHDGDGEADTYDVCMDCYAMGRSCACISKLKWVEQFPWAELVQRYEQWRQQILGYEGKVDEKSPMPLKTELERIGKTRTLAQVCQIELKKRPWRDITKPAPQVEGVEREEEIELDIDGNVKKKKKIRRSEKFVREHASCHVDKYWEPKWKQAECSKCGKRFCFGGLFRAYDMMPQDILANPDWKCPSCLNICGCRYCRKQPHYKPYTPSGTILGHNTKAVADPRSVESLVDFSVSNIGWIQKAGDDSIDTTRRLKKRLREALSAQEQDLDLAENYVDEEDGEDGRVRDNFLRLDEQEGIPIDPALGALETNLSATPGEDEFNENPEARINGYQEPMAPQYVVPEGGVMRTQEHAYDTTEAITYDYPDPKAGMPITIPVEEEQSEPKPFGCGPAEPDRPDHIEMISQKRKRVKLNEGGRSYIYKNKSVKPVEASTKNRQSLIVTLSVNEEKLAEVNKMQIIARRALSGVMDAPAPVIGSDLQALNTAFPNQEGQPPPNKKARTDQIVVDRDEEFMPGRKRDRRRWQEGLPPQAADITRRRTRMQAVTYEENESEGDFNERLIPEKQRLMTSKLVTMENAAVSDNEDEDMKGADDFDRDVALLPSPNISFPQASVPHTQPQASTSELDAKPVSTLGSPLTQPSSAAKVTFPPPQQGTIRSSPTTSSSNTSGGSITSKRPLAKQVEANKKAKISAMLSIEHEYDDDLDDDLDGDLWSDEEPTPSVSSEPSGQAVHDSNSLTTPLPTVDNAPNSPSPPITNSTTTNAGMSRQSLPVTSTTSRPPSSSSNTALHTAPCPNPTAKNLAAHKTALTEWDHNSDSDSDGGIGPVKNVVSTSAAAVTGIASGRERGWARVNGHGRGNEANGNGNVGGRAGHTAGLKPVSNRGRGTGR